LRGARYATNGLAVRAMMRSAGILLVASLGGVTAQATLKLADDGMHAYMSESMSYCYEHLLADPVCCKDQHAPQAVRRKNLHRAGAEWSCGGAASGAACVDARKGDRGEDVLWWPEGADCSSPRILYVHGGGWQRHGPDEASYDVLAAYLSQVSRAMIMVPDYPLVPVGGHETIIASLLAAWAWLAGAGPDGEDCSQAPEPPMFVAGDSSGAASALSLLLQLQSRADLPQASGFFAFSPWINLACDSPTYYSNAFSLVDDLTGKVMVGDILFRGAPHNVSNSLRELAVKYFGGDKTLLRDPTFSPFYASEAQVDKLPPLYFAVSGSEVLGGDGIMLAQRAAWRGARVYLDIFPGMWHGFQQYLEGCGSGQELWQASTALSHAGDFVVQVAKFLRESHGTSLPQSGERSPRTNVYYPHPDDKPPWSFVGELSLGFLHAQDPLTGSQPQRAMPDLSSLQPSVQRDVPKETEPQLSLVAPRALPQDIIICPQETIVGAVMSGLLFGVLLTLGMVVSASWYLTRRANKELPSWFPDFIQHPFDNFQDDQRLARRSLGPAMGS